MFFMDREYMREELKNSMPRDVVMYMDAEHGKSYLIVDFVNGETIHGHIYPSGERSITIDELIEREAKIPIGWKSESFGNETS